WCPCGRWLRRFDMSAPTPVVRSTPTGIYLPDGYSSKIAFAAKPALNVWEKTVTPSGMDGGDPIKTTTMHNVQFRTKRARKLKEMMDSKTVCAYDADVAADLLALINNETTITQTWGDGSSQTFYGFLYKVEFGDLKEGEFPEATLSISNMSYDSTAHAEAGPVFATSPGT